MSYNNENYYKLREEYAEKPLRAIEKADARKEELRRKLPGSAETAVASRHSTPTYNSGGCTAMFSINRHTD